MKPVLEVRDLKIRFAQDGRVVDAVKGVSFEVGRGEVVAIVGHQFYFSGTDDITEPTAYDSEAVARVYRHASASA